MTKNDAESAYFPDIAFSPIYVLNVLKAYAILRAKENITPEFKNAPLRLHKESTSPGRNENSRKREKYNVS